MAVYTKITFEELSQHLKNYEVEELVEFIEIIDGIDNSNFIVKTTKNTFIFTIFESRIDKNSLPYFINFKEHLALKNISCPVPIKAKNSQTILDFHDKKTTLVSFLKGSTLKPQNDGYYYNITSNHCFQVGSILAKMHLASKDFNLSRQNDLGVKDFENLFNKFIHLLDDYDPILNKLITSTLKSLNASWKSDLEASSCHLDLFPDNVFFDEKNQISGVIDFYFSANDLLIYDFAIVVNAWCFDKTNFNFDKFESLLNSYQKTRPFSSKELNFLETALIAGAMRFLLTRLHDMFFTPKNSLVKIKNPIEYKEKLLFFINNKILK
jgi:homoserine kinase type II